MTDYATVNDIIELKRPLTAEEQTRAAALISAISSIIRFEAKKQGKDFDQLLIESEDLAEVARAVIADVVMRELNTPAGQLPAVSYNESAGGISQSYSLPNASGRIALWPSDIKALGLKRQRIGAIDMMGVD